MTNIRSGPSPVSAPAQCQHEKFLTTKSQCKALTAAPDKMKLFTSKALCRFFVVCNLIMITTILPLYRLKDRKIGLEKKQKETFFQGAPLFADFLSFVIL